MTISSSQTLMIPFISDPLMQDNQAIGATVRKEGVRLWIDKINWPDYPYKPAVSLWSGYSGSYLWLCYEVKNDFFRARALADQDAVWEDSCVEFFMFADSLPGREIRYRNFEFNVQGYCLSAFGTKEERVPLDESMMKRILRFPSADSRQLPVEGEEFNWELCVAIPLDLQNLHPGKSFRANFYKCGDLTRKPHFLSWAAIDAPSPDFHLPGCFGTAQLAV